MFLRAARFAAIGLGSWLLAGCGPSESCNCSYIVNAAIWTAPNGDRFISGYQGYQGFLREFKAGSSDSNLELVSERPLFRGTSPSADDLFVLTGSGSDHSIARRRDGVWSEWSANSFQGIGTARSLWATDASTVFAASDARVLRYDGSAWSAAAIANGTQFRGIWGSSEQDLFAVGEGGKIAHFDGEAWTLTTPEPKATLNAVWGSAPDDVFAVGELESEVAHIILHFDGVAWTTQRVGAGSLLGLHGSDASHVVAVGGRRNADGSVDSVVLQFDGLEWSDAQVSRSNFVWDVQVDADGAEFSIVGPDDLRQSVTW